MLAGSRFREDERARAADQARQNLRQLSASLGGVLPRDQFGDLPVIAAVAQRQTFHDTFSVMRRPVLAHLPLAFEARDGEAEADNPVQHRFDEARGRIGRRPRLLLVPLLPGSEFGDVAAQPVGVVDDFGTAVGGTAASFQVGTTLPPSALDGYQLGVM